MAFVPSQTPLSAVQNLVERLRPYRAAHPQQPSLAQVQEWLARTVGYPDDHAAQQAAKKALLTRRGMPLLPTVSPRRLREWARQARRAWPASSAGELMAHMWGHADWASLCRRLQAARSLPWGFVVTQHPDHPSPGQPGVHWLGQAPEGRWWGLDDHRWGGHTWLRGTPAQTRPLAHAWRNLAQAEAQAWWLWCQDKTAALALEEEVFAHRPPVRIWRGDFSEQGKFPLPSFEGWSEADLLRIQARVLAWMCAPGSFEDHFLPQGWAHAQRVAEALSMPGVKAHLGTLAALWQPRTTGRQEGLPAALQPAPKDAVATQSLLQAWGGHWQRLLDWFDTTAIQSLPPSGSPALWIGPSGEYPVAGLVRSVVMEWAWHAEEVRLVHQGDAWPAIPESRASRQPASRRVWWMEGQSPATWPASLLPVRLAQARAMGLTWIWATQAPLPALSSQTGEARDEAHAWRAGVATALIFEPAPSAFASIAADGGARIAVGQPPPG